MQKVLLCFLGCILLVKFSWMVPLESACSVNFEYLVANVGFDILHQVRLLSGLSGLTVLN